MNNEDVFICELCEDTKVIGEESDVIQKFARVYQVVGDAKHRDIIFEGYYGDGVFEVRLHGYTFREDHYENFDDFLKDVRERKQNINP